MEKIHIVKALAQGMLIGEVKIPLGGVCLAHKKEFSDYLLEKKADSEVSEEINSKLKGANQQTQGVRTNKWQINSVNLRRTFSNF